MRRQELAITIDASGEVSFTVKGVPGTECLAETEFLEEALGGNVLERTHTSEYYQAREGEYVNSYGGSDADED